MRTAIVALAALGWLLALAPAAYAKGPTAATIEGPGLAAPVRIESYDATDKLPGLGTLMDRTGAAVMYDGMFPLVAQQPTAELGPRYTVTYYLDRQPVLVQELYPSTASGPYTFTPPGQRSVFVDAELPSGWFRSTDGLVRSLALVGVTTAAASATPAPQVQRAPAPAPAGDRGPLGWWLAGVLAVAGLASGAVLLHRTVGARR